MKYISCVNVPNAHDPPEIRTHLMKWDKIQSKMTSPINWLLECEERCLLSQDPDKDNCTRKYIESSQPVIGEKVLKILEEIILVNLLIRQFLHYIKFTTDGIVPTLEMVAAVDCLHILH